MTTLSLYDVRGIQEFIFSSSKLKENIGASILVAKVLSKRLKEAVEKLGQVIVDWEKADEFKILKDENINAEIVYAGGGNAMVAYRNRDIAKEVTKAISRIILEKTGGALRFSVAHIDTNFTNFTEDRQKLIKELRENKEETIETFPLLGIAITKQGTTDGLPAVKEVDGDFISLPAFLKREEEEKEKGYFDYLLESYTDYKFPREFDQLGQRTGERHLAVVHIDGNNMGKMMEDAIKDVEDYNEAVQKIRKLSKEITEHYKDAAKCVVKKIIENLKWGQLKDKIELAWDETDNRLYLPFRPLVLNGDDVTFVTDGRLGVALAEEFLREISIKSVNGKRLSACAGVAIVKTHFPFYRAYQLAERLCNSAKLKGKIIALNAEREMEENWLDFHIVYSGIRTELNELRKRQYNVPGMDEAEGLEKEESGKTIMKYDQFNLLWRPWCVAGDCEEKYKWENFKKIFEKMFKDSKEKWPRSKLKDLRDEFLKGKEAAEFFVRFCENRGKKLPEFNGNNEIFRDNQTPYFDALELLDFYIELEDFS